MGDPKKPKKKFKTPSHPWQKQRLDDEGVLVKEFGLKNKRELWKMSAVLRAYKQRSKKYIADTSERALSERQAMLKRIAGLGLIKPGGQLDDVLGLGLKEVMERRLQTIVYKQKMSSSIKQARQFITHRHIEVKGVRMTSPSYLVSVEEEATVRFTPSTSLADEGHPERASIKSGIENSSKKKKGRQGSEPQRGGGQKRRMDKRPGRAPRAPRAPRKSAA